MKKGTVLWFDWNRGFGFIQDDEDDEKSYFVHYTSIVSDKIKKSGKPQFKKLLEGEKVTFNVGTAPNGRECATDVKVLQAAKS